MRRLAPETQKRLFISKRMGDKQINILNIAQANSPRTIQPKNNIAQANSPRTIQLENNTIQEQNIQNINNSMNDRTINYYNKHAEEFFAGTIDADMSECRERFLAYLQPGQKILDAGCGSGRDILAFQEAGFEVEAFDASAELCRLASRKTGIAVKQLRFEELSGENLYDGIWACASLLHVAREDLPCVMTTLHKLLKENGIIYVSFKYGNEERQKEGRYFVDLTENTLKDLLIDAGFTVKEIFTTQDVRAGRENEKWIDGIAGK